MRNSIMAIAIGAAVCFSIYGAYHVYESKQDTSPSIGVVSLQEVIEQHPNFMQYKEKKAALDQLKQQRLEEEQLIDTKLVEELKHSQENLKSLEEKMTESLQIELQSKVALKEAQLQQELNREQTILMNQYSQARKRHEHPADQEIVNLQLALWAQSRMTPIDEAQEKRIGQSRLEKERRLQELLQGRAKGLRNDYDQAHINEKIQQELEPLYEKMQKELRVYAEEVAKELVQKRDNSMNELVSSQHAMVKNIRQQSLLQWNEEWDHRLGWQEDEVKALHDAILEDVRARAAVIAEYKHLDLVLVDHIVNGNSLDITTEIIQSYSK